MDAVDDAVPGDGSACAGEGEAEAEALRRVNGRGGDAREAVATFLAGGGEAVTPWTLAASAWS